VGRGERGWERAKDEWTLGDRSCEVPGMTAGGQARATESLAFPKTPEPLRTTLLESSTPTSSSPTSHPLYSATTTFYNMYPSQVLRMQPSRAFFNPAPVSRIPLPQDHTIGFRLVLTPVCRRRLTAVCITVTSWSHESMIRVGAWRVLEEGLSY
jgi:hypothetical protein